MDIVKSIKKIMVDEDVTIVELSKRLDTSFQNLSAKFKRNNLKISDIEEILEALGYDIEIIFVKKG